MIIWHSSTAYVTSFCDKKSKHTVVCDCRKTHGRALILDGVIQLTEKDEFSYQEMLASLPINCHPSPEKAYLF